ncbi:hypothetical protein M069_0782 [Bacteroides fragilis str. B1 (UDC16-1)]|nr:hypothetical protein M069_0782 [Bacteroides fragilis str. B1 (UDC16-1)]
MTFDVCDGAISVRSAIAVEVISFPASRNAHSTIASFSDIPYTSSNAVSKMESAL